MDEFDEIADKAARVRAEIGDMSEADAVGDVKQAILKEAGLLNFRGKKLSNN